MRIADVSSPATRAVLSGMALSKLTSGELSAVLVDSDFAAAGGDLHGELEDGILGELQDREKRGDPIARRTLTQWYLEPGDHIVCACGLLHEADHCPTAANGGVL